MPLKPVLHAALLVIPVAAWLAAADVSGRWSFRLMTSEGESAARAAVTLEQAGEKLTGTCVIDQVDGALTVAGRADDKGVAWRCVGKDKFEASFKGTIDSTGRQMTGEWTTGAARGTFKGSRSQK